MGNPWEGVTQGPQATPANQIQGSMQQGQQNIVNLQGQMGQYPAYPNDHGLGGSLDQGQATVGAIPGAASGPDYLKDPISVTVPDATSRGFNPWSLTGEANARGK